MSCVMIWPHCMFARVNCGSGTSASLNTAKDTNREFGRSSPVTEFVGAATPSPYLAVKSRAYLLFKRVSSVWILHLFNCILLTSNWQRPKQYSSSYCRNHPMTGTLIWDIQLGLHRTMSEEDHCHALVLWERKAVERMAQILCIKSNS